MPPNYPLGEMPAPACREASNRVWPEEQAESSPDDEGCPPGKEHPRNVTTSAIQSVPRCTVCGHHIYAPASIALGIGRDCQRRLKASLASADDAVRIAYAAALLRLTGGAA